MPGPTLPIPIMDAAVPEPRGASEETQPAAKKLKPTPPQAEAREDLCTARLMDAAEAAAITVAFEDASHRLPAVMAEHGVAIVTGVLGADDIALLESALSDDLAELVDANAIASADSSVRASWERAQAEGLRGWPAASLAACGGRGRLQDRGLPHGRFAWGARMHERTRAVYSVLHGTTDLVSSCDNAFAATNQPEEQTNKNWPHVDQNDHDERVPCRDWSIYQGILYLWSSETSHASTTVVWPGSEKHYQLYQKDPWVSARLAAGYPHFTLIATMEAGKDRTALSNGWDAGARRVPVPAGSLLLWTSRTTHQGWNGGPRLAQPVCWEPRTRRDARARERKMRLAALGLPSTHWASLALPHELLLEDHGTAHRCSAVSAAPAAEHDDVLLPLRQSIRPRALREGVDAEMVWERLATAPWMEPLPTELAQLLEDSISDEFKAVL